MQFKIYGSRSPDKTASPRRRHQRNGRRMAERSGAERRSSTQTQKGISFQEFQQHHRKSSPCSSRTNKMPLRSDFTNGIYALSRGSIIHPPDAVLTELTYIEYEGSSPWHIFSFSTTSSPPLLHLVSKTTI